MPLKRSLPIKLSNQTGVPSEWIQASVRLLLQLLVILFGVSPFIGARADVDVSDGLKMYGLLDQGMVNQRLTSPNTGVQADYSGIAAVSATSRIGFKGIRQLPKVLSCICKKAFQGKLLILLFMERQQIHSQNSSP